MTREGSTVDAQCNGLHAQHGQRPEEWASSALVFSWYRRFSWQIFCSYPVILLLGLLNNYPGNKYIVSWQYQLSLLTAMHNQPALRDNISFQFVSQINFLMTSPPAPKRSVLLMLDLSTIIIIITRCGFCIWQSGLIFINYSGPYSTEVVLIQFTISYWAKHHFQPRKYYTHLFSLPDKTE